MSQIESIEKHFDVLKDKFLSPSFQKIALTFCIPASTLFDTVHSFYFPAENMMQLASDEYIDLLNDDFPIYNPLDENHKSYYRLDRLAEKVLINIQDDPKDEKPSFYRAKIFDSKLQPSMISCYNHIADTLGKPQITKVITSNYLERSQTDEASAVKSLSLLHSNGYTLSLELLPRKAFSFLEYIVFSCLYQTYNGQSLPMLAKSPETDNQRKRAKKRLQKLKATVFSDTLYNSLVRETFNLLTEMNNASYRDIFEQHSREFWLSDNHRNLTHIERTLQKYALAKANLPQAIKEGYIQILESYYGGLENVPSDILEAVKNDETSVFSLYGTPPPDAWLQPVNANNENTLDVMRRFNQEDQYLSYGSHLFGTLVPVAELMLTKVIPMNHIDCTLDIIDLKKYIATSQNIDKISQKYLLESKHYSISYEEYLLAEQLAQLVDVFIKKSLQEAIGLLSQIPDAKLAEGNDFGQYLYNLK